MSEKKMRLIIGISGASGVNLGYRLLVTLKEFPAVETHLVITRGAKATFSAETALSIDEVAALAHYSYDIDDFAAPIASGSFMADGLIILPCSMKTLAGIAVGYSDNLLLRAADVTLKEGRRLILAPRESPLSVIHLKNLLACARLGAVIIPPMLTFYSGAATLEAQIDAHLGTILRQFGLKAKNYKAWNGMTNNPTIL